jgi:hypothetical protein
MNKELIKKLAGSAAIFGGLLAASAQVPVGPAPPIAALPAGLNPGSGPLYPTPSGAGGVPISVGDELFASGGAVYVTFLGPSGASYDEQLFVESPSTGYGTFMDDHSTPNGTTYYLGTFAAGTEIEFGLDVLTTGNVWYDGPASRNSDGVVHAYMVNDYQGLADTTYVGFEDESYPGGDFNYLDEVYAFTGTEATPSSVPDMSGTLALLGMSLSGLAAFGRRFRK